MTGRKFHTLLRFIHVCSLENQPERTDQSYDPSYKVKEVSEYLESHYERLFVPGRNLSLDETLIRAFGRIKFKVRIISKAARYGIKLYVITDAETAFVLKVIIYTGKTTYGPEDQQDMKKTVSIVKLLCQNFDGSYRTVFVDRFYTSIDLLKELDKMKLFVTGTCMRNRIPKELVIAKSSVIYKLMNRGDYKQHKYSYVTENNVIKNYGLVCWKDRDIVYCLTNSIATTGTGSCFRGSNKGCICIERPNVIGEYNKYMGGVDLADQRRLHCNSTIMGQHRWWLKLFFNLIDVATANSLVLYQSTLNEEEKKSMNIVEFKQRLVMGLVGSRIEPVTKPLAIVHELRRTTR